MALAIENARLLADTQQRAERERVIANITARVRASMDPKTILETAVRELGTALGTDRAFVQLGAGRQTNGKSQISNSQSPNLKS
jgi:GAF domain-containing protein